jgi:hypothetical protein
MVTYPAYRSFMATLLLVVACIFCGACISGNRFRGMEEKQLAPESGSTGFVDKYDRKILVAVGIDNYVHADHLRHAVGDAKAIVASFKTLGFEARELYDEAATRSAIIEILESAVRFAGPNDLVVFFFAGHGVDLKDPDDTAKGYLVPVDGRIREAKELVPMDWLQISLVSDDKIKAKHLLFLLDACSSGIVASRASVSVDPSVRNYISELMKRQARQVITAGTGNQQVLDGGYKGHSIFAGLILQGLDNNLADLNNDYHVTATELGLFLSERVCIESKGAQKPDFAKLMGTKGGEVILRFPNEQEKQTLAGRKRDAEQTIADLVINARPVAFDILVYDMQDKLVARKENVSGRGSVQGISAGDYQVIIHSRDTDYESMKMILGLYGPVVKNITLPRRMYRLPSVPPL